MEENERRDDSDFLTALAIGAVVGIGTALLFRASDDFDRDKIIKRLKPLRKKAKRALRSAGERMKHSAREGMDTASSFAADGAEYASKRADYASRRARRKMKDVAGAARIVKKSSSRIAHGVGDDMAKILADAQRDLEASARDSVKQARRAMRRAAKRLA